MERIPTAVWKNADVEVWLNEKQIEFESSMINAQLKEIVKKHKAKYNKHVVDEMAREHGITILRLPNKNQCKLNPIELVCAQVKGYVLRNFELNDIKKIFEQGLAKVTSQKRRDCINHVTKVEETTCNLNHIVDNITDR